MQRLSSAAPVYVASAGVLLIVAGVISLVLGSVRDVGSFGWFAYQPVAAFPNGPITLLTPLGLIGLVLGVTGVILVAGYVGYVLGVRRGMLLAAATFRASREAALRAGDEED